MMLVNVQLFIENVGVGASVGTKKRSVTSMTDALSGDVMDKIRHKRESRSRRSVNASALIKTFLDVYKYPDVPMNLIQFVSDVIGVFGYGKEPRTVTQLKQQFDDVEEQIEVIKETVEQQAWMMKRHSTPRMPCRKKNFGEYSYYFILLFLSRKLFHDIVTKLEKVVPKLNISKANFFGKLLIYFHKQVYEVAFRQVQVTQTATKHRRIRATRPTGRAIVGICPSTKSCSGFGHFGST